MTDLSNTCITSLRMGAGSLKGIDREIGSYVVVTSANAWRAARPLLGRMPETIVMVDSLEKRVLDDTLHSLPVCQTIVGIGGGRALDAAKYFAWSRGYQLVSVPAILSSDAFASHAAAVREDHELTYVGHSSPDPLIVDFDLLRLAPPALNIAGISNLLSIHTATFDWELAHKRGRFEYPFFRHDVKAAKNILKRVIEHLIDIRAVNNAGLTAIVEGCLEISSLCLPAGHYRAVEGSEHYLAYELEERRRRPLIHGPVIGLGVYLMSRLQNNNADDITRIMDEVNLEYHPKMLGLSPQIIVASLQHLKSFVAARDQLWYTILDETEISQEWAEEAISLLRF
jgi:glycerol-1-phosphate dehydrogenase [NAD(P)+]